MGDTGSIDQEIGGLQQIDELESSDKSLLLNKPLSFLRQHRLLNAAEFDAVFKGKDYKIGSAEFLILAKRNSGSNSRIGMVIGKKTTKLAVNRNRIKRAIRESFRLNFSADKAFTTHLDVVIVARPSVNKHLKTGMSSILDKIWSNLGNKVEESLTRV